MKIRYLALILGFVAAPAFAQSIDLPRLTWPTDPTTPATQGCNNPAQIGTGTDCAGK